MNAICIYIIYLYMDILNSTDMYLKASSVAEIEDFHMFIYIYHALNYWDSLN